MEVVSIFPHLNATLNGTAGVILIAGFWFIRRGDIARHRIAMVTASTVSAIFLASYVTYHSLRSYYFGLGPTRFTGEGISRPIYFTILTSHTILAVLVAPFIVVTLWRGLRGRYESHKRLARLVFPVWLYVSVTGVIVYVLLYQIYPAR